MLEGRLPLTVDGVRLERSIGRGAMGEVFAATDLERGIPVAVKFLPDWRSDDPLALERFRREGALMARITHPNCVRVFDARELGGYPAIVMELMSGQSLESFLFDEPQPVARVVNWMLQVLDGLSAVHAVGVLHRDIKPANGFLDFSGGVKLGDFGLARSNKVGETITGVGASLGTPLYASPEQLRGERLDERADIYSAGAMLYALLCGVPAHHGRNATGTVVSILREEPQKIERMREGLDRELGAIVRRAMAKSRSERFDNAKQLRAALIPFVH